MPVVPALRGARTWLRGVLVVGDRRTVGDPRTTVACAGQHGSPRWTTREALPPCDCGRHPVHRGRWYPVAATANGVPASRDDVGGVRPLGPQRSVAVHPRRAARPTAGAGRAGPLPDRGDHRRADATRPPTPCPIQPRLGWRQENERRQAAHRRGGERPVLTVVVTAASIPDRDAAHRLLAALRGSFSTIGLVWADGGYPGRLLIWAKDVLTLTMQIIKRIPGAAGFHVRPRIWVVERSFAWINKHRRCVRDYETRPDHHEAMVHLAIITTMTRRLART